MAFVPIGFALKGNVKVGFSAVAILQPTQKEFQAIPQIEKNQQQFYLLTQVDFFVVYKNSILPKFGMA